MSSIRKVILLAIAASGTALAQGLPDYYPESFQRTGTVDDIADDRIVIDDTVFGLSAEVLVHTLYAEEAFVSNIRPGQLVGYLGNDAQQIVEIWILPDNYERRMRNRGRGNDR